GEVGYHGLSLDSIARRAGVHKTTVYRRWQNRDLLLLDALLEQASDQIPIPDTGSLRDDLVEYGCDVIASITTPAIKSVIRAYVAEAETNPVLRDAGRTFYADRFKLARDIVARAVERGELPRNTNTERLIEIVTGAIYLRLLLTGERLDRAFVEEIVDVALAGAEQPQRRSRARRPRRRAGA
ncbi:MAG: TetR/AcrR family transcriptional regulator C-terminal ligand-binding domain-containing protein, partial [Pseudonocardiaceae bacterium]